jgi:GNAT superfamily N-acetyltransferase
MSAGGHARVKDEETGWRVFAAAPDDAPAIARGVRELLLELGGRPAPLGELTRAAEAIVGEEDLGLIIVALDDGGDLVGLLGASWQVAVRAPGRYGLIQELWVHRDWRGRRLAGALLAELLDRARERGIQRIEVGLPGERFAGLAGTRAFYERSGFVEVGMRMKKLL